MRSSTQPKTTANRLGICEVVLSKGVTFIFDLDWIPLETWSKSNSSTQIVDMLRAAMTGVDVSRKWDQGASSHLPKISCSCLPLRPSVVLNRGTTRGAVIYLREPVTFFFLCVTWHCASCSSRTHYAHMRSGFCFCNVNKFIRRSEHRHCAVQRSLWLILPGPTHFVSSGESQIYQK